MENTGWVSTSMPYITPGNAGRRWAADAAAAGRRGSQRIVGAGEVPAPSDVAELLGVDTGEPVVVRRRIMLLDDEPYELTDSYYPAAIARGTPLATTGKIRGGALGLLAELGHVGARVQEDVTARLPDAAEAAALRTAPGEPVLCLLRLTLDAAELPVQVDRIVMPAGKQGLRYELRIG